MSKVEVKIIINHNWTLRSRLTWAFIWIHSWIGLRLFYRLRVVGKEYVPQTGAVLLISNHQSFFDPPIVAMGTRLRYFRSMARKTLFKGAFMGWVLESVRSVSVDQKSSDLQAMRSCMTVLEKGQMLLIFPEGARTHDGQTGEFASGIALLMKRSNPMVVPVAIEGAYGVWPRTRKMPRLFGEKIGLQFGPPRQGREVLGDDPKAGIVALRDEIEAMRVSLSEGM